MEIYIRHTLGERGAWAPLLGALGLVVILWMASPASAAEPCRTIAGTLLSTANSTGQTLTAWEDLCSNEEKLLIFENTRVAVGSVGEGFKDLGTITLPTTLSSPTGVVLDDAGDGWVSGVYDSFSRYGEKESGAIYAQQGGWLAFRPAGGAFDAPMPLTGGAEVESTDIAGNAAGQVLVAWSTPSSAYLAWATPNGGLTDAQRFRGPLSIVSVGVDSHGRGLLIATEGEGIYAHSVRKVLAISGAFGRRFAAPRPVLTGGRDRRRNTFEYFDTPDVAMNSDGGALVATTAFWVQDFGEDNISNERSFLEPVSASGTAGRLRNLRPVLVPGFSELVTGAHGGALLEAGEGSFLAFGPGGRLRGRWHLGEPPSHVYLVSNAHGQVAAIWSSDTGDYVAGVLATVTGAHGHSVRFATREHLPSVSTTIDAHGVGTLFWSDEGLAAAPTIYAHAIDKGGPVIEVARGPAPATTPEH